MKKNLIATFVGAIIIFIYQALSWTVSPIHKNAFKYAAGQTAIMPALTANITEDGMYYMPNDPPGTPHEEMEKSMKDKIGKPWAMITYYSAMEYNMPKNMSIGFIIDFLSVWIIVFILSKASAIFSTMGSRIQVTLFMYLVVALQAHFMEWNWIQFPMHFKGGEIIDNILSGILLGWWLGWYMGRVPKTA
jgi:hypothetical protein